jgi:glycosyltransferase involved in cell wall biosynthesis
LSTKTRPAALAIIGAYPPPFGGMSTHVQRLTALLDERGLDYVVYNATSASEGERIRSVARHRRVWLFRYLLTAREPAVYMLTAKPSSWLVAALLRRLRRKRVAVRLRNSLLLDLMKRSPWRAAFALACLRNVDTVVCVNERLADALRRAGVPSERVRVFEGFLPPLTRPEDRDDVPQAMWDFASDRDPLIAANGRVAWRNGEDLYGLDLLVGLAERLAPEHPKLGIAVCFWDHAPADDARLEELRERATRAGVGSKIFFQTERSLFLPVLAASRLFVRPTRSDGDANSVREALYLGVPALASDAAPRPAGTLTFRSGDLEDFERCVRETLAEPEPAKGAASLTREDQERLGRYLTFLENLASPVRRG